MNIYAFITTKLPESNKLSEHSFQFWRFRKFLTTTMIDIQAFSSHSHIQSKEWNIPGSFRSWLSLESVKISGYSFAALIRGIFQQTCKKINIISSTGTCLIIMQYNLFLPVTTELEFTTVLSDSVTKQNNRLWAILSRDWSSAR